MKTIAIVVHLFLSFFIVVSLNAQHQWTLEDCIQRAREYNAEVLIQKMRNHILEKETNISKNERLPGVNLTMAQNFSLGNSFNVSTSVGQLSNSSTFFSLNADMPIFDGYRYKYQLQKSTLGAQKGKAELARLRFDLSVRIIDKYLQVLFFKETLRAAEEQLSISRLNLERLEKLNERAFADKRGLLEVRSIFATDQREVIAAQNSINNGLIELSTLLQIEDTTAFDIREMPLAQTEAALAFSGADVDIPVQNHPLLKPAQLSIDIRRSEIGLTRSAFYPKLNFSYSLSSNYFHIFGRKDQVFNSDTNQMEDNGFLQQFNNNRTHFLGFTAVVPVFNKLISKQHHDIAREELTIAELEMDNHRLQLDQKVRTLKNDVKTAYADLKVALLALNTQQEAFDILQQQYHQARISHSEFLEAKSRLIRRQSEFIRAKYNCLFKTRLLELYRNHS